MTALVLIFGGFSLVVPVTTIIEILKDWDKVRSRPPFAILSAAVLLISNLIFVAIGVLYAIQYTI